MKATSFDIWFCEVWKAGEHHLSVFDIYQILHKAWSLFGWSTRKNQFCKQSVVNDKLWAAGSLDSASNSLVYRPSIFNDCAIRIHKKWVLGFQKNKGSHSKRWAKSFIMDYPKIHWCDISLLKLERCRRLSFVDKLFPTLYTRCVICLGKSQILQAPYNSFCPYGISLYQFQYGIEI